MHADTFASKAIVSSECLFQCICETVFFFSCVVNAALVHAGTCHFSDASCLCLCDRLFYTCLKVCFSRRHVNVTLVYSGPRPRVLSYSSFWYGLFKVLVKVIFLSPDGPPCAHAPTRCVWRTYRISEKNFFE